jgi:hypothetical protein
VFRSIWSTAPTSWPTSSTGATPRTRGRTVPGLRPGRPRGLAAPGADPERPYVAPVRGREPEGRTPL